MLKSPNQGILLCEITKSESIPDPQTKHSNTTLRSNPQEILKLGAFWAPKRRILKLELNRKMSNGDTDKQKSGRLREGLQSSVLPPNAHVSRPEDKIATINFACQNPEANPDEIMLHAPNIQQSTQMNAQSEKLFRLHN